MAETKVVNLEIKTNADATAKSFTKVADVVSEVKDNFQDLGKTSSGAEGGIKKIGNGIKGVGLAFKAAGIGLIIAGFATLKEVFSQNQKVANFLSSAMETVSIVFNEVTRVVTDVYDRVNKATGGFNALGKVIGGLITIALSPLKAAFYSVKLGIEEVQLIWEKSFFGNKDQATIKNLQKEIKLTQKDIVGVGKEVIQAGKDIGNNFVEAVGEVGSFVTETAKGISDISIKAAYEQAQLNIKIQNAAKIAAAQQSLLIERYDRTAEKLRQVRDEERNTIDERIKANNDLGVVLEKQQKALLKQADLQIAAARNEVNKSNNIENQIALLEAQANREGVLAQIEGLRSEQLVNDLALNREKLELTETLTESETTLANEQKRFDAERILDEYAKLEELKKVVKEEKDIELSRLQTKIDSYKLGTQARLEAQIEYNTLKQELDNEVISLEDQQRALKAEKDKEQAEKDKEAAKKLAEDKAEYQQRQSQMALNALSVLSDATSLFSAKNEKDAKNQFKISKALSLSSAVVNTAQAITAALATTNPVPGGRFIEAAIAAASGAVNIAKIAQTQFASSGNGGGGGASGGGGGASNTQAITPNFNIVGNNGLNQLNQLKQAPIQAYVVSGQVSTAQALDRNRIRNATF